MNIINLIKAYRKKKLFLKIYFCYLTGLDNKDLALYFAKKDFDEVQNLLISFSVPQRQKDTQRG